MIAQATKPRCFQLLLMPIIAQSTVQSNPSFGILVNRSMQIRIIPNSEQNILLGESNYGKTCH